MTIDLRIDPDRSHVAHLEFDFGKLNLFTTASVRELRERIQQVPDDVAILTIGAASTESDAIPGLTAGLDLTEAKEFSTVEARAFLRELHATIDAIRNANSVTICRCGEYALGAGLELAMACDFRVATEEARLGLPEIRVGLVTGIQGGLLIRLVGVQTAKELIYTGEPVSGARAKAIGLVNEAVPSAEYEATITALVNSLSAQSPLILQWQKEVFRSMRSTGLEAGIEHSLETIAICFDTHDQREAMAAFLDGREPSFEGR